MFDTSDKYSVHLNNCFLDDLVDLCVLIWHHITQDNQSTSRGKINHAKRHVQIRRLTSNLDIDLIFSDILWNVPSHFQLNQKNGCILEDTSSLFCKYSPWRIGLFKYTKLFEHLHHFKKKLSLYLTCSLYLEEDCLYLKA